MIKWKIDRNVICGLYYKGQNIINPWGFETADSSSFFSLEENCGWRYKKLEENYCFDGTVFKARLITQMRQGKWNLSIHENIRENAIIRKVEANTLEDSLFMDFVMRFRFKKKFIAFARILDNKIYHNNTNIYYQYAADKVFLKGKGFDIWISIIDKIVPKKMEPVVYVRDHKDEWIVHIRMVPKEWDMEVVKICTSWAGTRPIPQIISKPLLSIKAIKDSLWYRGERNPYKSWIYRRFINPCAFGMVKVGKSSKLMWHVKLEIV